MSESLSLPRKTLSRKAALWWLAAIGLLLIVALAVPLALLREQVALFATIQYNGADSYPVVPAVPFPGPPTTDEVETVEIDGLRISLPKGSIDWMEVDAARNGLLKIHLREGFVLGIDIPVRPPSPHLSETRTGEFDEAFYAYFASPKEFSWGASGEETRRLGEALAWKKHSLLIDSATGVSRVTRPNWQGFTVRAPSQHVLIWMSQDEDTSGVLWAAHEHVEDPKAGELADFVFGSFEVVRSPSGTYDADAKRLAAQFPAPKQNP